MATSKNKRIAAAQRYTQKGQLDKAIKEYIAVVEDDPSDVRIWLKIGDLQTKKGAILKAVQTYNKVADHYSGKGFFLKAVAVYKQILNIDPTHIDAHLKLAELYVQLGLTPDAIGQFQIVVGSHEREGRSRDSMSLLKKIVELAPDDVANRIRLAEAYAAHGDSHLAVEEFTLVLDQLHEAARLDEFIQVAERLLYISADELDIVRRLSDAYLRRGDAKRALARLQVLFRADPTDVETLELLANAFQEIGQRAKAVSVFRELARIHAERGDEAGRQTAYARLLSLSPDDAEALEATGGRAPSGGSDVEASMPITASGTFSRLGGASSSGEVELTAEQRLRLFLDDVDLYLKYELRDHAMERLQRAFEIDPHNVEGLLKLKTLSLDQQKEAEAVDALLRLAEATRESDPQQAMEYLGEALQLHPNHPDATQRMRALSSGMAERLASHEPAQVIAPLEDDDFGDLDLEGIQFDDQLSMDAAPAQSREEIGALDFELDLGTLDKPAPDDDAFGDLLSEPPAPASPPPDDDDDLGALLLDDEPTPSPLATEPSDVIAPPPPPMEADDDLGALLLDDEPTPSPLATEPSDVIAPPPPPMEADDDFGDLLLEAEADVPLPPPGEPTPVVADDDFGGLLMDAPPVRESVAPAAVIAPPPPPPSREPAPAPGVEDEDDFGDLLLDIDPPEEAEPLEPSHQESAPGDSIDALDLVIDEADVGDDLLIGMNEADDELLIGEDTGADELIIGGEEDQPDESMLEDAMEVTVAVDPNDLAAVFDQIATPEPSRVPEPVFDLSEFDETDLELKAFDQPEPELGDLDEPEPSEPEPELDLGEVDEPEPEFDLDLGDIDEPRPEPEVELDLGDFDQLEPEVHLDLGEQDEAPPEVELDQGDIGEPEVDLDLGEFDEAEPEVELDLGDLAEPEPSLDVPEPAAEPELDLDLSDFDEAEPAAEPELDLDLSDLDEPEPAAEPEPDLDLGDLDEPEPDLELGDLDEPEPDLELGDLQQSEPGAFEGSPLVGDDDSGIEEIELDDDDIIELDDDDLVMEEDDDLPDMVARLQAAPPPTPVPLAPSPPPGHQARPTPQPSEAEDRTLMAPPEAADLVLDPAEPATLKVDLNAIGATPRPAEKELTDGDLEELDFFLTQGFTEDATEALDELWAQYPEHPTLIERRARISALSVEHPDVSGSLDHLNEHEGDLGTVVGTELSELTQDDAETHFDLGVAFKEMGQHKKAISELEIAARNPDRRPEALRVIALCNLEQGKPKSAAEHLGQALTSPHLSSVARVGLHYDLATAFEQLGDTPRAIAELRAILDEGASDFLDVQARLTRLGG